MRDGAEAAAMTARDSDAVSLTFMVLPFLSKSLNFYHLYVNYKNSSRNYGFSSRRT